MGTANPANALDPKGLFSNELLERLFRRRA